LIEKKTEQNTRIPSPPQQHWLFAVMTCRANGIYLPCFKTNLNTRHYLSG